MANLGRETALRRVAIIIVLGLAVAACGGRIPPLPTPTPDGGPGAPDAIEPIDEPFTGALPQSATFLGVTFTVTGARISNVHPYPMFGEPPPGEQLYAILAVVAENTGTSTPDYSFTDEAFGLRSWSGRSLPIVPTPGVGFSRVEAGARIEGTLAFGVFEDDPLGGAILTIGKAPDALAVVPLDRPSDGDDTPEPVRAASTLPVQTAGIEWRVLDGSLGLDRPAGVCCPETGLRADEDERFLSLTIRGLVKGSQYGTASITTDLVRLMVDGVGVAPLTYEGRGAVPEGQSIEFTAHWVIPADLDPLVLRLGAEGQAREMVLEVGS
jgi:hypothetical protein